MTNLMGTFTLNLFDKDRELKCNFGVAENLERNVFKRPLIRVLNEAANGEIYTYEIVDCIIVGLKANGDTRYTRKEIGDEVVSKGVLNYVKFFSSFLAYAVTGETEVETENEDESETDLDKKK